MSAARFPLTRERGADGQPHPAVVTRTAERLVGVCFRRGMTAIATGEVAPLAFAWQEFANVVGPDLADPLVVDLSSFVEAVCLGTQRRIETLPTGCPGFCRDECLAISIVAASQHSACPALKACAFALLASSRVEATLQTATVFAQRLKTAGQMLGATSVCNAAALVPSASQFSN